MNREHGHFHWNELMTWNREAAREFYGETLGWTYNDMPMPDGVYTLCMAGETPVGGIFQMDKSMEGAPDHWFAYIAVDDIDARVARVAAAGGSIIRPVFEVPEVGRIALVKDKAGAAIGWIEPAPAPEG